MISATIKKAAETIVRLDALRKKMATASYLKKKRTAQHNKSRIKERQAAERLIERALEPFFVDQIQSAAAALAAMVAAPEETKSAQQTLPIVFNPNEWNRKLIDTLYPAMVKIAVVGMDGEMRRMGLQIKRGFAATKVFCPTGPGGGVDATCGRGGSSVQIKDLTEGDKKKELSKVLEKISESQTRDSEWQDKNEQHTDALVYISEVLEQDLNLKISQRRDWRFGYAKNSAGDLVAAGSIQFDRESKESTIKDLGSLEKGGGSSVVDLLVQRASEWTGNKKILVEASPTNQGFYEKMGFVVTSSGDEVWMEKVIDNSKTYTGSKSTATDLLSGFDDSNGLLDMGVIDTPYGPVNMAFLFEYPDWMKQAISEFLKESFSEPYWAELNKTTYGDIEKYLQEGIRDGWSIEKMASEMAPQLLEEGRYAKIRGRNIARTEAGHALNGARSMGIDSVIAELAGTGLDIQKLWHSVRGTTTRDDHRAIHGVPADSEGMWTLAGYRCRWPGDTSLPPAQRCNCQCTIESAFGMSDEEARQLIQEHEGTVAKASWSNLRSKVFCPTGPGGGQDPSCSPGKKERSKLLAPLVILGGPPVGQEEFIGYLEKHGQEYTAAPKPKGIKKGVMKQCYMNATKLAISKRELTYVEGLAYTPKLGPMAVAHAWVVDKEGKVIDNTWDEPETCQYFGVPVPTSRLEMWMVKTKVYGIFGGADKASRELIKSGEKP